MVNDDLLTNRFERKARLREVFKSTIELLNTNERLIRETETAKSDAIFYDENARIDFDDERRETKISVTGERTFEAARRLLSENSGKVAVLNFANSVTPGGGVLGGSGAQEESLCRCSNLYPIIEQDRFYDSYYDKNRSENDFRATDAVIYARNVTVFKSDTDYPELLPEDEWYKVDVITCAAPNLNYSGQSLSFNQQTEIHRRRAEHILRSALANNARRIVLGAFGCGAFRNNPDSVIQGTKKALESIPNQFDEIVFAIYHQPYELKNYQKFKRAFDGPSEVDYDLTRFVEAHNEHYEQALSEIKAGRKESHWMWYIFPQLQGLGFSRMSYYYGISDIYEAKAYLNNKLLKDHLLEISNALYKCDGEIIDIMGNPDYMKLLSCMTLFKAADPSIEIFQKIIDKFFLGQDDRKTLEMINL